MLWCISMEDGHNCADHSMIHSFFLSCHMLQWEMNNKNCLNEMKSEVCQWIVSQRSLFDCQTCDQFCKTHAFFAIKTVKWHIFVNQSGSSAIFCKCNHTYICVLPIWTFGTKCRFLHSTSTEVAALTTWAAVKNFSECLFHIYRRLFPLNRSITKEETLKIYRLFQIYCMQLSNYICLHISRLCAFPSMYTCWALRLIFFVGASWFLISY